MPKPLRILHLEDTRADSEIVRRTFVKAALPVEWKLAISRKEFETALKEFAPDIIISDHNLPGFTSVQALKMVKAAGITVPFILVTATISEEFAVNMIKDGVADYILKDRLQRLPSAVQSAYQKWKTEREKNEHLEEIRKSEANLIAIIENSEVSIYSLDREFRYITFNSILKKTLKQVYGLDIREGDKVFDFLEKLDPARAREWETVYSDAFQGKHQQFVKEFLIGDFHSFVSFSINPILENNLVIGLSCFALDITEQMISREKLIKSEANIRSIYDSTHVGYILLDTQFRIASFNQVAARFSKVQSDKELNTGNYFLDYFSGQRRAMISERYHEALKGAKVNYETSYPAGEGASNWYDIQMSLVSDTANKILGLLIAITNITEKKESELQREKITGDLIQRNKDLEQFAYIVSHNLRAPVANILGIANVLEFPNLESKQKELAMKSISSTARKLDEVIIDLNNILQVKREFNERKELVKFSELTADICASIGDLIAKESVKIVTDFSEANEFITLKSYLYSIFYNLIINSIKYRQADLAPVISITSSKNKKGIQLNFKDNGLGIDLVRHGEKVFGLYKRFHSLETEGKGMGLYMVKTQVESLGGKISLTSEVKIGTEFSIEFEI